jgi:hypothetical protein
MSTYLRGILGTIFDSTNDYVIYRLFRSLRRIIVRAGITTRHKIYFQETSLNSREAVRMLVIGRIRYFVLV